MVQLLGPVSGRQQLALRKKETADRGVEERQRLAAENLSEGRKRYSEQKKKQVRHHSGQLTLVS